MLTLEKALQEDAKYLAEIQKASFDDESQRFDNSEEGGGPPGYDSEEWQKDIMQHGHYFKILWNNDIVGGAIIFADQQQAHCLGRIFIDPKFQDKGIGTLAIQAIESEFQNVSKWWLDTPQWSTKNHHFYAKCGYSKVGERNDEFIFEKFV
ncbi:GNAT superfamily N-acetyltransferase [Paenibacillus wynnii]|nr:GNAT superfamily N-acetyltransferase [Paenibacillus wynnii]